MTSKNKRKIWSEQEKKTLTFIISQENVPLNYYENMNPTPSLTRYSLMEPKQILRKPGFGPK